MDEIQNQNVETNSDSTTKKSNNTKWVIIIIVVLVVLFVGRMFSPSRIAERALEQATGGDYTVDVNSDGTTEITGGDGQTVNIAAGKNVSLPDNWPDTVPVFDNAKIIYAGSVNTGDDGVGLTITYTTSSSASDVANFYKNGLAEKGWKIESTVATGDGSMLTASQGEGNAVAVYISESNGETTVNVNAQAAK